MDLLSGLTIAKQAWSLEAIAVRGLRTILREKHARPLESAYLAFGLLSACVVSVSSIANAQEVEWCPEGTLILAKMWNENLKSSTLHLFSYRDGNITKTWEVTMTGTVNGMSLNDINGDGKPEVVVVTGSAFRGVESGRNILVGATSLLIYENLQGAYTLVFNKTTGSLDNDDIARACIVDYYGNQTEYLLVRIDSRLLLMTYDSGKPAIRLTLPVMLGRYGFDAGDVNGDGRADTVYRSSFGTKVLENQGNGTYIEKLVYGPGANPVDEIRVGDVDGDGVGEIVAVGLGTYGLFVYKAMGERYDLLWSLRCGCSPRSSPAIQSVDVGDVDGDGLNEIVVASEASAQRSEECRGVSVWKYQPEIVYRYKVLERGGFFFRAWEDKRTRQGGAYPWVGGMLALRVLRIDEGGREKIVGIGGNRLYLGGVDGSEYKADWRTLWSGYSSSSDIDAWWRQTVAELRTALATVLVIGLGLLQWATLRTWRESPSPEG